MKFLQVLLLAVIAATSVRGEGWCRCAVFVTYEHTEMMVYEEPQFSIVDCDTAGEEECNSRCTALLNEFSNDGDLWYEPQPGITIGQQICTYLSSHHMPFFHNHRVYGYFEKCGGAWEYTGVKSQQMLCCNGGKHEHCVGKQ